jgi:hypothetical protein
MSHADLNARGECRDGKILIAAIKIHVVCPITQTLAPPMPNILDCVFGIYFSPLMSATSTLPVADSVM